MTDATAAAKAVIDVIPKGNTRPILACWMGETSVLEARKILNENGIPDFEVPEHAVEAFSYLARHEYNRRLASEMPIQAAKGRVTHRGNIRWPDSKQSKLR
jgi:acetyltransferase